MKHIRIIALSLALVLMLGLFTACSKSGSGNQSGSDAQSGASVSQSEENTPDTSTPEQGDVSVPDASAPEEKPEEKPQTKPQQKPEEKPDVKPESPAPAPGTDETIPLPLPETKPEETPEQKPAGVDLAAFYETIFTDPDSAPALVPMEGETLDAFYPGLTALTLNQKVAYMPMMTAVPCEIVMVECANSSDVATVKSIFQARITSQVDNHFNYPMVIEAWETEATVVSNGNFVALFVVSGMTDEVVSNFNALF